jgi:transcriptional regulator with XRE-family HTH domain
VPIDITPRLAQRVEEEREKRGLTHDEIAAAGGPSSPTMTKIASGEGRLSDKSARLLEGVLGWPRGSVRAISVGQEPSLLFPESVSRVEFELRQQISKEFATIFDAAVEFETGVTSVSAALRTAARVLDLAATDHWARERASLVRMAMVILSKQLADLDAAEQEVPLGELDLAARRGQVQPSTTVGDQATAGEESQVTNDDD